MNELTVFPFCGVTNAKIKKCNVEIDEKIKKNVG